MKRSPSSWRWRSFGTKRGAEQRLDDRMAAVDDVDRRPLDERRPHVAALAGDLRERGEGVDVRERVGGGEQIVDVRDEPLEQRAVEIRLEAQLPRLRAGDRRVELAQLGRHVALAVGQRLAAHVVGRERCRRCALPTSIA